MKRRTRERLWFVDSDAQFSGCLVRELSAKHHGGEPVAVVLNPENARLISAVHELLEVARCFAAACSECHGTGRLVFVIPARDCFACADVRLAIAKAEGSP